MYMYTTIRVFVVILLQYLCYNVCKLKFTSICFEQFISSAFTTVVE